MPPPPKKRIKQIRINIAPVKRVKLLLRSGYTRYYHLTFLGPPYRLLLVRSKENFKYEVSDNNQEENQNTKLRYFLNLQQRFALLSLFLVYPNPTPIENEQIALRSTGDDTIQRGEWAVWGISSDLSYIIIYMP